MIPIDNINAIGIFSAIIHNKPVVFIVIVTKSQYIYPQEINIQPMTFGGLTYVR